MSFPGLLVRLQRHRSISISFQDEQGETHALANLPQDQSELLQHEIDHLHGVLAVDRALPQGIIGREVRAEEWSPPWVSRLLLAEPQCHGVVPQNPV